MPATSVERSGGAKKLKRICQLSTALGGILASPALAQSSVPPMPGPPIYTTVDDNGVDLASGSYTPSIELVSIGPTDNPLSHMFTGNMSFNNLSGSINSSTGVIGTTTYTFYKVSVNGASAVFIQPPGNPAIFSYIGSQGQSLVFNSSTQQYTYTDLNKVVTVFSKPLGGHVAATANEAAIISRTYPSGEVLTYSYVADASGFQQLRQVSSNRGFAIRYEFTGSSTISKITAYNMATDYCDVNANSCSFSRSWPSATVTSQNTGYPNYTFTDQMGRISSVIWNATGVTLKTPTGRQAILTKDSAGRVASVSSGGSTWSYSYSTNSTWFIAAVTDPLGQTRSTTTDTNIGRPIFLPDSAAGSITLGYDQSGNLTTVTYPEGNSTGYTRDSRSNITRVGSNAKPGSGLASVGATSGFDTSCTTPSCNKPNWTKDANGNQTDYTYDPVHGGILTETLPAATSGGVRPQTRYTYSQVPTYAKSSTGSLIQVGSIWATTEVSRCATTVSCVGAADESKTIISYAGSNNLQPISITVKAGDGSLVSTETRSYDPSGDVLTVDGPLPGSGDTTTYRYDADRETVGVISPDPDGTGTRKQHAVRMSYNADGQPTMVEVGTVTGTDDTAWAAFSSQQQLVTTYDSSGRKATEAVTGGGTTYGLNQYTYDADGRLDCTAQRMNTSSWGSLPSSACTAQTAGTAGPDRITKYGYDAIGRRTNVTTGFGTSAPVSRLTTAFTGNGKTASETDGNGNVTSYAYDGLDRLQTTTYPGGSYEQFGYDANGSLTSQRLRDGTSINFTYDNLARVISKTLPNGESGANYTYDLLGRVLSVTQGTTLTYVWDALGRLQSETQPFGVIAYKYDAGGNRTRLTWPDGFYVSYVYDTASELTAIRENGALDLANFSYDDLGRRQSLTRGNGVITTYGYDPVSRLSGLNNDLLGTTDDHNATFTFNPASQISSVTRPNTSYNYTNAANVNRAYVPNALNQYTSAGSTSFSYDARGNLATSDASTYGYTSENLLKTAPGGVSLFYDASGRLSEYDTNVSTRFIYDADHMVAEVANPTGAIQKRYVFGPGADEPLVEYDASGNKTYLVADERGSIVARTNPSGSATVKNTYDEYGIPGANNQGRFQYTGQAWLTEIGLSYYKARIYSPTMGRFLQTDPIGYGDGLNWYNYVHNDPINGVDPTGLRDICYMVDAGGYTTTTKDEIKVVKIQNCIRFNDDSPLVPPFPLPPLPLTKAQYDGMCFTSGGWDKFFRDQSDPVQKLGASRKVDPLLLLGVANLESQHGTSYAYRARLNPFGATPSGDSTAGLRYSSFSAAWSHWDSQWGPRIQGVGSDADQFTSQLLLDNRSVKNGVDNRGSYNSENPNWASTVKKTTADAAKRYTKWLANGCGS